MSEGNYEPITLNHDPYRDGTGQWWDWNDQQQTYVKRGSNETPPLYGVGPTDPTKPTIDLTSSTTSPISGGGIAGGGEFMAPAERFGLAGWRSEMPLFMPDRFSEPDPMDAMKDPSYDFEQREGVRALEQGAAARGVLNGGGTLKDVNAWGQNFATSRVADVRNRAVQRYQLNYRAALDAFTARMSGWQTQGQVGQRQNEDDWLHAYTPWNDQWNRRVTVATA